MRNSDALDKNPYVSLRALEATHDQLFGWSLTRCGFDRAAAEDLMQQAYVEVLSGRAQFNNNSSLKTFLFGVVQNLARSRFRRLATRLRLQRNYSGTATEDPATEVELDHCRDRRIWQAVEALPARQRDITELVFCRDMTIEEAASVMGVSIGTARVHYDRAKKALAARLAEFNANEVLLEHAQPSGSN